MTVAVNTVVFETRMNKLQQQMQEEDIDLVFLPISVNLRYITGLNLKKRDRLIAAIIPKNGEPAIVVPTFEVERIENGICLENYTLLSWEEDENPYAAISGWIQPKKPKVAVEGKAWFNEYSQLFKAHPTAVFTDACELLGSLRIRKDDWEKDQIKEAIGIAAEAREATLSQITKGMTESEACKILCDEELAKGAEMNLTSHGAHFARNSSMPHGGNEDIMITEGTVILIDHGVSVEGYNSDITRTTAYGQPEEEFERIFDVVLTAQKQALKAIQPGLSAEQLDSIARDVIVTAGYGKYFSHRLGHGLGMEVHEPPWIGPGEKGLLEAGMVFTVEPGIYIPGRFGVRIEDDVMVTDAGCEILSDPIDTMKTI